MALETRAYRRTCSRRVFLQDSSAAPMGCRPASDQRAGFCASPAVNAAPRTTLQRMRLGKDPRQNSTEKDVRTGAKVLRAVRRPSALSGGQRVIPALAILGMKTASTALKGSTTLVDGRIYGASHSSAYISSELVSRNIRGSSSGLRANELGSRSFSEATFWGLRSLMPILKTPSSVPPLAK